ncbi:response regulator [Methanofollis fontis]|uniref:Response regulator n=2 Tax=Methanofollis fontis TaxID=2052832 RepID=A0A483CY12_9EURY|nr:response regulator [Methanofollis fontis]
MKRKKILIVEDEALIAMLLEDILTESGYNVAGPVSNGMDAIRLAGEEDPDLILMDIRIEGDLDGVETTIRIRELYTIPVIFVTAHSDPDTYKRAMRTEPFGFLLKPFNANDLTSTVESAIQRHQETQI